MMSSQMILNAFTVDVEDYFHVSGFERDIPRESWPTYESRVIASTWRLIDLLARHDVRATFFVLGWVAEQHPQLVRDIRSAGHEIGSHSSWHRLIYEQSPSEFREDLRRSRDVLEDITGSAVTTYRAPSFSITRRSLWALEILVEEGFEIDASIFPVHHDRYGIPDAKREPHRITTPSGSLWEFPAAVIRRGINWPVSGGGYFRMYPAWLSRRLLTRINEYDRRPFAFYVHPWEIDPEQPRLRAGSVTSRLRHRVNLQSTERKLSLLLERFRFATISQSIAALADHAVSENCLEIAEPAIAK
jgi:polysaccharide deacetylase family protein (PEP-CTERM system associated)